MKFISKNDVTILRLSSLQTVGVRGPATITLNFVNKFYIRLLLSIFLGFSAASAQGVGSTLPDFALADTQGNIYKTADFAGRPLLLNFWATWCPPCQEELPLFQSVAETTPDIQVFLVNTGETLEQAKAYLEQSKFTLPK